VIVPVLVWLEALRSAVDVIALHCSSECITHLLDGGNTEMAAMSRRSAVSLLYCLLQLLSMQTAVEGDTVRHRYMLAIYSVGVIAML